MFGNNVDYAFTVLLLGVGQGCNQRVFRVTKSEGRGYGALEGEDGHPVAKGIGELYVRQMLIPNNTT